MTTPKSILVATIGTRDIAFAITPKQWYNLGNDRSPDSNSISEQALVQTELRLEKSDFRFLTEYLLENWEQYQNALKPIILGKLLQDQHQRLQKVYLVATDQLETVKQRDKDTLYSAQIIQRWIETNYHIPTQVILQGAEGYNPSNFEEMFRWWKQVWRQIGTEISEDTPILLCLKGGVGQSSEASRVTALSRFGEDSLFYDFKQDEVTNSQGFASEYYPPFQGTNYLWDRKQQEALSLLRQYNYEAVSRMLKGYYKAANSDDENGQLIRRIHLLLEAAIQWNIGNFKGFATLLDDEAKVRSRQWWWTAYEAAYLAVIRFQQSNTVEALFHSFRSVEGLIAEWAEHYYSHHIEMYRGSPCLKLSIKNQFSDYLNSLPEGMKNRFERESRLGLYSTSLYELLRQSKPNWQSNPHISVVWEEAAKIRNEQFHRLRGLEKIEVFQAWKTANQKSWEARVLGCLNFVSEQEFTSLKEASLMSRVHEDLKEAIASYQP
jgi:hypothetical protein